MRNNKGAAAVAVLTAGGTARGMTTIASYLEHGTPVVPWEAQGAAAVRRLAPALSYRRHKGQAGRIGVLGGSAEYTGAPFYAASAALRVGADLAWVFAAEDAATAIKSYSPELVVVPAYGARDVEETYVRTVRPWLERLHGLVVGPGLGRDPAVLRGAARVLEVAARDLKLPVVVDADGLFLVAQQPALVAGCPNVLLTPNQVEYDRIKRTVLGADDDDDRQCGGEDRLTQKKKTSSSAPPAVLEAKDLARLCRALGGVAVVKKGRTDLISDGEAVIAVDEKTAPRRCGGLGDLLSGSAATLAVWAAALPQDAFADDPHATSPLLWAAYGACVLARRAAAAAFAAKRRATLAPDVLAHLGDVFERMVPTVVLDDDDDDRV